MYKCRLLITFENSSGPTKCSHENACMCRLVSALAAQEKNVLFLFQHTYEPSLLEDFFIKFGSSCPVPKMNSYTMRHGEILYMQLNNEMFIYFKMCL